MSTGLKKTSIFFDVGLTILVYLATSTLIGAIRLTLNINIRRFDTILYFVFSIIVVCIVREIKDCREILAVGITLLFIFTIAIWINGLIYTMDVDGNYYHKVAVGFLKNGWNPILQSGDKYAPVYFNTPKIRTVGIWIDNYGKTSWLIAAPIYALTGNIETGKVYQILSVISLVAICHYYLRLKNVSPKKSIIIALCVSINPISLVQIFSYYVDGFLMMMLYVLIIGLQLFFFESDMINRRTSGVIVFSSMLILTNIKYTGLLFAGIYSCTYFILYIVSLYRISGLKHRYTDVFCKACIFSVFAVVSVFIAGYPTYVKNFRIHGNPLYPLVGEHSIDIITPNSPSGFEGHNGLFKFMYSFFGTLSNPTYTSPEALPMLKSPFSIVQYELIVPTVEMRISGFGLWFSGIFIVSLIICIKWLIKNRNIKSKYWMIITMHILVIFTFIIAFEEGWWARYAPYLYILPIIALITFLLEGAKNQRKAVALTILMANTLFFITQPIDTILKSIETDQQFQEAEGKEVCINIRAYTGKLFNLEDHGIRYTVVDTIEEPEENKLYMEEYKFK